MKRLYYIVICICVLLLPETVFAQGVTMQQGAQQQQQQQRGPELSRGSRESQSANTGMPDLTARAQDMNERMVQEIGNARWMRVIYRELDLEKEANAPLYYPIRPVNDEMNLFTTIFQLMSEGKLTAYEYVPDYEFFDDDHIVNFKDVLDRAYIYYEEIPGRAGAPTSYVVNEADIPSGDVLAYYVKEAWYFDQNNSMFDVKILAICPLLTMMGDFGEQRMPLFWLPYENIRPYVSNRLIMTSSVNNAKTFSIDDYFRRRMFEGDIIKTENLMNKTLQQFHPEPDSLKLAQQQIEQQLEDFQKALWMQQDSAEAMEEGDNGTTATTQKATSSRSVRTSSRSTTTKAAAAPKAQKTTSAPVRSVRRTR